jgi:hypothetical protein
MTARGRNPQADHRNQHDTPDRVRRCSKGHLKNEHHADIVRLNLKTSSAEWAEAARRGYVRHGRWNDPEHRRQR